MFSWGENHYQTLGRSSPYVGPAGSFYGEVVLNHSAWWDSAMVEWHSRSSDMGLHVSCGNVFI